MNLHDLIEEITHLENPSRHKIALDIFNLLENNRILFLSKLDEGDFNSLLSGFEQLAYAHPKEYASDFYTAEFERRKASLLYHFNKIL